MGKASQRKRARRNAYISTREEAPRVCPVCHAVLDAATGVYLDRPSRQGLQDGDLSLCAYCGTVLMAEAGVFRVATNTEIEEKDPDLRRLLAEFPPRRRPPID